MIQCISLENENRSSPFFFCNKYNKARAFRKYMPLHLHLLGIEDIKDLK